jgi:hypothetical protein
MAMVCPQCKQSYDQQLDCPTCGTRLGYQLSSFVPEAGPAVPREENWEHTAWSRLAVGLLLAQGLAYGTQHLFTAGFLASDQSNSTVWATLMGLVLLHLLQGACLMIGAAVTGAGQRQGTLFGSLIGLIHGLIFLLVQRQSDDNLSLVMVSGQPILFTAVGALGGRLGMMIWKPIPMLPLPGSAERIKFSWSVFSPARYFEGPVYFSRVMIGTLVVVIGVVWSNVILSIVITASGGTISTHLQDRLLLFEITALATLAGAGLAGATTRNGLKQGLCVGIGASVVLVGVQLGSPKSVLETTMFMVLSTCFLSLAGGWFGGQLFPPIVERRRRGAYDMYPHRW